MGRTPWASNKIAVLPAGTRVKAQLNCNVSPSISDELLPSSVTSSPVVTTWSSPAFATGRVFAGTMVTRTSSVALSTRPSLTTSVMRYCPATSATKVGMTEVAPARFARLPLGTLTSVHRYVSGSPSASVEPEPFKVIVLPMNAVWSAPALARGARFAGGIAHCANVQRRVQIRASFTVIVPSRSGSRGSVGPLAGRLRAAVISAMSLRSMSASTSTSQASGVCCASALEAQARRVSACSKARAARIMSVSSQPPRQASRDRAGRASLVPALPPAVH